MNKNLEVIRDELKALKVEYLSIIKRFKYVTLPFQKSRVPADELYQHPKNNEFFHLIAAFIEEFYDKCPRCCAYLTITILVVLAGSSAFNK